MAHKSYKRNCIMYGTTQRFVIRRTNSVTACCAVEYVCVFAIAANRLVLTHCGRVRQICVFNTVNLGTSASSP